MFEGHPWCIASSRREDGVLNVASPGPIKRINLSSQTSILYRPHIDIRHYALPISVELDRMYVGCMQDTSHLEEWLVLYRLGRKAQRRAES